jgi:hypothetical protein
MKQILLALFTMIFCTALSAQCDKNLTLTSSKTEYLDASGAVQRTVDEITKIDIDQKSISISPGGDHTMTGTILSVTCGWKTAFKEGKSEFKTEFDDNGTSKKITIVLEGKNGKVSFTVTIADEPDKIIRVWSDTFGEKK